MSRTAYSADGAEHTFPDDTPDSVVDKVMLDYARSRAPPKTVAKTAPAELKTKYASSDDWFKRSAPGAPPKPKAPKLDFAKTFADIEARKLYRVDPDPAELFPGGQRGTMPSAGMPTALEMRELASGKKETATPLDAVVRFGTRALAPTLAAMTAAPSGAALGSPLGPVGSAVGALSVGTLAGISTAMAQDQGLKMLPERFKESVGQADWQLEAAARERPRYALFGSMAPSVLTGRPTRAIKPLLGGAVLGGGGEAVGEFVSDQPLNLGNIAMASGFGMFGAKAWPYPGRLLQGTPDTGLEAQLRTSGVLPRGAQERLARLQEAGITPLPIELLDPSRAARLAGEAAAAGPDKAAALLRNYADRTAERLPTETAPAVEEMVPGGRTPASLRAEAERGVEATTPVATVAPGEGGRAVQTRLTQDFNTSDEGVKNTYATAAKTPDATLEPLDSGAPDATWQRDGKDYVNTLTNERRSAADMGPKSGADIKKRMLAALKANATDLRDDAVVGATLRQIDDVGGATTARQLLDAERILAREVRDYAGSPRGVNARIARTELWKAIDELDGAGRFLDKFGYADEVVQPWRDAIAAAREHHKVFSQNDAIEALSNPTFRGQGAATTELDPDYVSNYLLGPNTGVSLKANSSRDLKALRDYLGANSPEWEAVRKEAAQRIIGDDPTKAAARLAKFDKNPKEFVDLLLTPEDRAVAAKAAGAVKSAGEVESGVKTGAEFATTSPADFADSMSTLHTNPKAMAAKRAATRKWFDDALANPDKAYSQLSSLARNDNTGTNYAQTNLAALFGKAEAEKFVRIANTLVRRVETAKGIRPADIPRAPPSQGGVEGEDAAIQLAGGAALGGAKGWVLRKTWAFLRGKGMSEKQAAQLATDALDPDKTQDTVDFIKKMYGQNAAQAFAGRVRAAMAKYQDQTTRVTGVVTRAGASFDTSRAASLGASEEEAPAEEAPAAQDGELPPPPEPPTAQDEMASAGVAYDPSVPIETINAAILGQEGTAKNPASSAVGKGQIVDDTFIGYMKRMYPNMAGMSNDELLKYRKAKIEGSDRTIEDEMLDNLSRDNLDTLASLNAPVNATTLYLAHFFGAGDLKKVLQADAAAPLSKVVPKKVIDANPYLAGKTVGETVTWAADLMTKRLISEQR